MGTLAPLVLVILCNTGYHLISKSMPGNINPFLGLVGTYGMACLGSVLLFFLTKGSVFAAEKVEITIYNLLLGLVVIGVEGGYMLMYRAGWEVSRASLTASICLAVVLVILGTAVFHEALTVRNIFGILLCIGGVIALKG